MEHSLTLNTQHKIPVLGFGVYQVGVGQETQQAVRWAIETGYRHIDTASFYKNEKDVGEAIKTCRIPREELFITTKLWLTDFLFAEKAFHASREKLGLDYLDLYLIHWPAPTGKAHAWKVLEKLHKNGFIKSIGVSNYSIQQLDYLLKNSEIAPAVNQVEFSPFLYQKDLLEYCQSKKIVLEAYSPLTRGKRLDDKRIEEIALKYQKSPAQIMIRWSLQHGNVVLPKSSKKERIQENFNVFDFSITDEDMSQLDALNENYSALFK